MIEKAKRTGDMINSRKLFDDSEKAHPITEDEMIKIEKIHGTLLPEDLLWDTVFRRMKQQNERTSTHADQVCLYEHGTHFVFQSMLKTSVGSDFL